MKRINRKGISEGSIAGTRQAINQNDADFKSELGSVARPLSLKRVRFTDSVTLVFQEI